MRPFVLAPLAGLLGVVALSACRQRGLGYETITRMPIAHELPLPPCAANAPAAFQRRHDATQPFDSGVTWGRLHVRLIAADSTDSLHAGVVRWHFDGFRRGQQISGGEYEIDSLSTGPVVVEALAIGFDRWRDTVLVRAGYTDTVVAGLTRSCRRPG